MRRSLELVALLLAVALWAVATGRMTSGVSDVVTVVLLAASIVVCLAGLTSRALRMRRVGS